MSSSVGSPGNPRAVKDKPKQPEISRADNGVAAAAGIAAAGQPKVDISEKLNLMQSL